jgi:hypothetical protein
VNGGAELHFNYKSDESLPWDDPDLKAQHRYEALYPESGDVKRVEL